MLSNSITHRKLSIIAHSIQVEWGWAVISFNRYLQSSGHVQLLCFTMVNWSYMVRYWVYRI